MNSRIQSARLSPAEARELCDLLAEEARHYGDLLDLAREQGRLMREQDVAALAENARRWEQRLPVADSVRIRRERHVGDLQARLTPDHGPGPLGAWLQVLPADDRREVEQKVLHLRRQAAALARQNALNRRLAEFCLDLVEEEAAIFRRGVLEDPAGRYDGEARPARGGGGSTLTRQA